MKNSKSKVSPPQSMDKLGNELLSFCKNKASKEEVSAIIAELEEMKTILENAKIDNSDD